MTNLNLNYNWAVGPSTCDTRTFRICVGSRGGSVISGKRVHMFKCVGCSLSNNWFYLFFLKYLIFPWNWNNLVSLRPNYFIFIGYLKTGGGAWRGFKWTSLNPLWIRHRSPTLIVFGLLPKFMYASCLRVGCSQINRKILCWPQCCENPGILTSDNEH